MATMEIPIPPSLSEKPTIDDLRTLHVYIQSLHRWLSSLHIEGLQSTAFATADLTKMQTQNIKPQAGKIFFNQDTGKLNCAEMVAGNLVIKEITTT